MTAPIETDADAAGPQSNFWTGVLLAFAAAALVWAGVLAIAVVIVTLL